MLYALNLHLICQIYFNFKKKNAWRKKRAMQSSAFPKLHSEFPKSKSRGSCRKDINPQLAASSARGSHSPFSLCWTLVGWAVTQTSFWKKRLEGTSEGGGGPGKCHMCSGAPVSAENTAQDVQWKCYEIGLWLCTTIYVINITYIWLVVYNYIYIIKCRV